MAQYLSENLGNTTEDDKERLSTSSELQLSVIIYNSSNFFQNFY